ncbi:hypothetical protein [Nocardiopsis sp. JB363]|uniref:hypothetical protein n=1 Tax=Nocardiopsis sp. JB363 TaxID=1434837 RepID=UPI000B34D762|nr:hypothetical protein [Nocardiopsis sp. JB363]
MSEHTHVPKWAAICPHMGAAERSLLHVLFVLTETEPVCVIAPAQLRKVLYSGPVDIGEAPKRISSSGLMRLLRNLAALGQLTRPEGTALTFSSREATQERSVPMHVHRDLRHECETDPTSLSYTLARGWPSHTRPGAPSPPGESAIAP